MTKGDILIDLSRKLTRFVVPDLICFEIGEWNINKQELLSKIKKIKSKFLIVRSSALTEDSDNESEAGLYDSIMNVNKKNENIINSIDLVINSFVEKNNINSKNKIIVQRQLNNVSSSGVIFSHELNTGAPYYVINYDDKSGSTDSVTSGKGVDSNRTLYIHRNFSINNLKSPRFKILLNAVKELEKTIKNNFLDIEFALDQDFKPYLFQVRNLTTSTNWNKLTPLKINNKLKKIKNNIGKYFKPVKNIYGDFSVLAQMPDWNPVEMLGRSPKRLDLSLYKVLIQILLGD